MSTADAERLRAIKTFPSLVKYLRDELDWPIESDDFDELTFEYEPEELGLDPKSAVKVKEIKQLRPLASNQPWGIFFINFEPKQLPVVVLRRILRALVLKKRQSANRSHQAAWNLHDLLFISSYGESNHRDISFAHFAEENGAGDLPTLRVLGWDDEDTVMHIDHADKILREKLRWSGDSEAIEGWRSRWSSAFTQKPREVIGTSKALAKRMAELAIAIRKRVNKVLAVESEDGALRKLMKAFKESLIHDLSEDDFADMYAQTVTYGLLTARVSRPSGLVAQNVAEMVPITNPFLRDMLSTFLTVGGRKGKIDFDELGINDVVQALRDADMEAVLRDFGDRNPEEDPVIHFYELFLKEYDPVKRVKRGVFFTPRPVVSFIVRSVDEILRKEFGLGDGLADTTTWGEIAKRHKDIDIPEGAKPEEPFVKILDPACGTGTFLVEVIDVIERTMKTKWRKERHMELEIPKLWNDYVADHLLPRLYGFELMMAPYAIAHMKLGLKLHETGYNFRSHERARIYLTNTLEEAKDFSDRFEFDAPALAHEAHAVNAIKRGTQFTAVMGNPPYSASISEPPWLMEEMEEWKRGLKEIKMDLNREEWKFLRLAQLLCARSSAGIVGMVTNRDFLDGIAKRRMREDLQISFPLRLTVDLNGDVKGNISDENVFEIEQGVCISILASRAVTPHHWFTSLVGTRDSKYRALLEGAPVVSRMATIQPIGPYYRWVATSAQTDNLNDEYAQGIPVNEVMDLYSSGIQTKRDKLTIQFTSHEMFRTVKEFDSLQVEKARSVFELGEDGRDWKVALAKKDVRDSGPSRKCVSEILYRPFDLRYTYWTGRTKGFLAYPRREVMQHIVGHENIALLFNRQIVGDSVSHFGAARWVTCHGTFYLGNKGQDYCAPLYVYQDQHDLPGSGHEGRRANFTGPFLEALHTALGLPATEGGRLAAAITPEDVFHYALAVFHSPAYRSRYEALLKIDFPRLPLANDTRLFRALSRIGADLTAVHLLEDDYAMASWNLSKPKGRSPLQNLITKFAGKGKVEVSKGYPKYAGGRAYINPSRWFEDVPEKVWNFHIGGYQVCEKWLKDRRGRTLSDEDILHYQRIIVALNETIRLMGEIDKVIDAHGGWPGAFLAKGEDGGGSR